MENKEDISLHSSKPRLHIIDTIDRHGISKGDIVYINRHGYFSRVPFARSTPEYDVIFETGRGPQPSELFSHPFTVEVIGAGFDKLQMPDTSHYDSREY